MKNIRGFLFHRNTFCGRLRFVAAALSCALLLSLAPGVAFADGDGPDNHAFNLPDELTNTVVNIVSEAHPELNLGVKDSLRREGAPIVAVKKRGSAKRFEIVDAGDGAYAIRSARTGRLVTERDGSIVQTGMTAATDDSQRWIVAWQSGGYVFTNKATANRLSVSRSRAVPAGAGTEITDEQVFQIEESPITFNGYYSLVTREGNVIALSKAGIKNGTGMVLKKNTAKTVGKQFLMFSSSNGYHAIKNSISFKAFSIKNGSKASNVRFIQKTYKKSKSQRFRFVPSGDGWYLLKSARGPYVAATRDAANARLVTTSDRSEALKVRVKAVEYSSGNPKLDAALKKLHKKIGSKGNTLRKSFSYVVTHFRHRDHGNDFSGDWITRYAWYMVSKGHGHCKNFAATLCVLLRSYGYDAQVVTGYVPSRSRGWAVHGWVEATVKGKTYIFDADLQVQLGARGFYKRTYRSAPLRYRVEKRW